MHMKRNETNRLAGSLSVISLATAAVVVFEMIRASAGLASADVFHGRWIRGAIEQTYHRLGGFPRFGDAVSDEMVSARDGRFQNFSFDNSAIYWHPAVDNGTAHEIRGRIRDKWADFRWELGKLGYPRTDELTPPDGKGRFNHFEGGSIYWHPDTDAHEVEGLIFEKWAQQGYETGPLRYPTTDELTPPDGKGRFNHFQGGSIYWHPSSGVHIVSGQIRAQWEKQGWETGELGYPISDRYESDGGYRQDFQGGAIQTVKTKNIALPSFDGKPISSYRQILPIAPLKVEDVSGPVTLSKLVTSGFGRVFPLTGCSGPLVAGKKCSLVLPSGERSPVIVDRIADHGLTLKADSGNPEGEGRLLTFYFESVKPGSTPEDGEVLFESPEQEKEYEKSGAVWLRLVVEATGPTKSTRRTGPFISDHVGAQLWPIFAARIRDEYRQNKIQFVVE